jgi:predicted enzyme related to lactoylglutathione lyase
MARGLQSRERRCTPAGMTAPAVQLGFFKLNVPEMEPALAFWREAFGFAVTMSFDEPDFAEHVLALPGQEPGPNLILVEYKAGRDVTPGPGHGPVGLTCADIAASHEHALVCGAHSLSGIFEVGGVKVALIRSPQGHEIELIELPG